MELLLLGPVELRMGGTAVYAGGPRQRSILAALAANAGRPVPVETLIDWVWGEEPPQRVRHSLHVYIARLRTLLSRDGSTPARVAHRAGGYQLDIDTDRIDIHRFQRLADQARPRDCPDPQRVALLTHALDLWRGPPLSDLSGEWAERVRQGWQHRYQDLTVTWALACLRLGNPAAVLARLGEVTGEYPLVESLAAVYMRALYAAGRGSDALEHHARLRQLLAEALGADPGPELQQLHRQILIADPALAPQTGPPAPPAAEAPPMVPRQLPAPPQLFTGRAGELADLDSLHAATTVVVTAIDGMAGIGKTALAVQAAHRLTPRYPDGQLFIDLHGYTQDIAPVEPGEALERMLRTLGVAGEQIPAGLDERAALYRTRLAGRQMLILLDNAATEHQVVPLLPGEPSCLVLVTSRGRLTGLDQTQTLSLDTLPMADALTLLTRTLGGRRLANEAPELLTEAAELCGRLPLAIRVAAARLRSHPTWNLTDLVERLRDHQHRLAELEAGQRSIRAALDLSYQHLTADQQRTYRLLGLHPGPDVDTYAVAALDGTTLARARRLLDHLHEAHLLQEPRPGRYVLHDLTRAHANLTAMATDAEPDRRDALTRLFDHYRHAVSAAMNTAYPYARDGRPTVPPANTPTAEPADPTRATAWLDAELPNLLAAAQHAADGGWPEHTIDLSAILHSHLHTRGHHSDAGTLHNLALAAARATGNRASELAALNGLGQVHRLQGQYEQAVDHHRAARRIARTTSDRVGELTALNGLGDIHLMQDRYERALEHYRPALRIARTTGHHADQVFALTGLGDVHRRQGSYQQALEHYRPALEIARTLGFHTGQLNALRGLGQVHRLQGQYEQALEHYRAAQQIARTTGHHYGELTALRGLGDIHRLQGRYGQAAELYQQLLDIARHAGNRNSQFEALQGLGRTHQATGQPDTALTCHRQAMQLATDLGQPADQARALDGLAHAHQALNQLGRARQHWQQALDILTTLGTDHTEDEAANVPAIRAHLHDLSQQ